ncbi:MAG TPA: hypothetical protein VGE66_08190 [Chitinophagaceae bacterium]
MIPENLEHLNVKQQTLQQPVRKFRDLAGHGQYMQHLVNAAWVLATTALWNTALFSASETAAARTMIAELFATAADPYKAYLAFGERVLLARHYLAGSRQRYVPLPTVWLHPGNEKGYRGTEAWHRKILEVRASLPVYKIELRALAEGVLEMSEEPTVQNFLYWKSYFIDKRAPGLLQLFLGVLANGFYSFKKG